MTGGVRFLFAACGLGLAAAATARPPAGAEADKLAVAVLKDVHDRGAELYNRGDAVGCYRMYEGALRTVRPFVAHRPAVARRIDAGLADAAGSPDGVRNQAFRLHQLIEDVRTDLKAEVKKAEAEKAPEPPQPAEAPKEPAPKAEPPAQPKAPTSPPVAAGPVGGRVTLAGKPVAAEVMFVSLTLPAPRVFVGTTAADGAYTLSGPVLPGEYAVKVAGAGVPAKFAEFGTSGLRLTVTGAGTFDLNLQGK